MKSGLEYVICQLGRFAIFFPGAHNLLLPLLRVCSTAGSLVLQQEATPLSFVLIGPRHPNYIFHQHPKSAKTETSPSGNPPKNWNTRHTLCSPPSLPRMKLCFGHFLLIELSLERCRALGCKTMPVPSALQVRRDKTSHLDSPPKCWIFGWTFLSSPFTPHGKESMGQGPSWAS